jgi:hypothetical protein
MRPASHHSVEDIDQASRSIDAIEAVGAEFDDQQRVLELAEDIERIDEIFDTDPTLTQRERTELYDMGINLRLDWLYAEHGGRKLTLTEFVDKSKQTEAFLQRAATHAYEQHDKHPQAFWAVQMKVLDLRAYEAHRFAADSQTTLKDTDQGRKLFGFSDDMMRSVVGESIRLMADIDKRATGDTELAQDARGVLYEHMLLTYARQRSYETQDFDTVFIRSALSREDRPWNGHAYPKRAFDIVISSEKGNRLLQAKNYQNSDEYAWPIEKVQDDDFGQTLDDVPNYLRDFQLLLDNPTDPNLVPQLDAARHRLDNAFGTQLNRVS